MRQGPRPSFSLPGLAVRRPVTVAMLFLALSLLGWFCFQRIPVQLMPDLVWPTLYVQAGWPGADPEQVEQEVVIPLEGEIARIAGVAEITSTARQGQGTLEVKIHPSRDLEMAYLELGERVRAAQSELPQQAFVNTTLIDLSQFSGFVALLSVRGDAEPDVIRRLAEQRVAPRIEGVEGVVRAVVTGGQGISFSVEIDPEEAAARGLNPFTIRNAILAANSRDVNVGSVVEGDRRLFVTLQGRLASPQALADVVVAPGPVLLRDVARVGLGLLQDERRYRVDGLSSVGIYVNKDETSNLLRVGNRVRAAVEELNEELDSQGFEVETSFDASEQVRTEIHRLIRLGLTGAGFAVLVLLFFLRDLRAVSIIAVAIPVSVMVAGVGMALAGLSLNVFTLMAMTLAVGMLVDNAIVSLEAIDRRRSLGDSVARAARRGGTEVQRAMLASTATTVVVFLPLAWLSEDLRDVLIEFALSILMPLLASLLVALLLVPMLASVLLRDTRPGFLHGVTLDSGRLPWTGLRALLASGARHPVGALMSILGLALLTLVVTAPLVLFFFVADRPSPDRVEAALEMPAGTTIEETDRIAQELERRAMEIQGVEGVETVVEEETSYFTLHLHRQSEEEHRDFEAVRRDIEALRQNIPAGAGTLVMDRSLRASSGGGGEEEASALGLGPSREKVLIRGADHAVMAGLALEVRDRLEQVPQVVASSVSLSGSRDRSDELRILPDRGALALHGLTVQDLMQLVWSTRREVERLDVPLRWLGEDLDIAVGVAGGNERSLDELGRIQLATSEGASVPLGEIAEARVDRGPRAIQRKDRSREIPISFRFDSDQIQGADALEDARTAVEEALGSLHMPAGTTAQLVRDDPTAELRRTLYLSIFLLFLVLTVTFESFVQPLVVIFSIPLALIGVAWSLALTGSSLELSVILGLMVLVGIIVNGAILLVDRAQVLVRDGGWRPLRAVLQASRDRTRPVLMTAATTIMGLLPMTLKSGTEYEIWPPFAIAVIGGLLFGTLLTLLVIPTGMLIARRVTTLMEDLGWTGAAVTLGLWAATLGLGYWQFELVTANLWRWFWVFPSLPAFLLAGHALVTARRRAGRRAAHEPGEGPRVVVRNATKVYGAPGPFLRALAARRRREARRAREGRPVWSRTGARQDLLWEIPVAGTALWFQFFWLESDFWFFVLTWINWAVLRRLLRDVGRALGMVERDPVECRWAGAWEGGLFRALRVLLFLAAAVTAHVGAGLHWVFDAIYLGLSLLVWRALGTAAWLRREGWDEEEDQEDTGGLLARSRHRWRSLVAGLPVLGRGREQVAALRGVTLEVGDGMFGLLGPNGAGKTTLLRMVAGVLDPSRGVVRVEGLDVLGQRDLLQGRVGYLPQDAGLYDSMTARDYLEYHALLQGAEDPEQRARLVEEALQSVALTERADDRVGSFSGGMRQRVGIARTLLDLPDLLVVDEPTVGLDPAERIRFRTLLARLARRRTILFSTHVVEDVATACDRLAVMDEGRLCFVGTPEELRRTAEGRVWEIRTDERGAEDLRSVARVVHTQREATEDPGGSMRVRLLASERPSPEAQPVEPSLEDAYLLLVPPRASSRAVREVAHG